MHDVGYVKLYYKDHLLQQSAVPDLFFINSRIMDHNEFIRSLILIDVLASDSFTALCFRKQEVPFIHSEVFRDGY